MANNTNTDKEFALSSWAIERPTIIYVLIATFFFIGLSAYFAMPREDFPEVSETKIYVSSTYPGNTAEDIERLITDQLEDALEDVSNVTDMESTSQEDYSIITITFDENITVEAAKQKVKDKIDTEVSSEDWPLFNGAKVEPNVFDLSLSEEIPIMNITFKGDYPILKLKEYAEYYEEEIENISEIKQVDIRGVQDEEVEVAVDIFKMMAAKVSFDDVLQTINRGNMTISAGNLKAADQRRTIRILGEIEKPEELETFVVKNEKGSVYLRDIAAITFGEEERTTFARESGETAVMLDVKKRSGKNMITATDQIYKILEKAEKVNAVPADVEVVVSNDQSNRTLGQVDDLVNNIIFGVILVVGVLMFFLGFRNALFVGFAIPMSMFMSFMILNLMGYTLNTMILFGLIMGLGLLVDNGIVVVENVFRLIDEEGMSRVEAAKKGIGEIAVPIIISTLTTVAAFAPLGFWPGIMGDFMMLLPITLSVVLFSSLFVAIFFNSMLVSKFMSVEEKSFSMRQLLLTTLIMGGIGALILFFGGSIRGLGSLMIFTVIMIWFYKYLLKPVATFFQRRILTWIESIYEKSLRFFLGRWTPYLTTALMGIMFVGVLMAYFGWSVASGRTKIEFFPDNIPNQVIVYIEYPQGTAIEKTNEISKRIEQRVFDVIKQDKYTVNGRNVLVESAVTQVGEGAGNPQTDGGSTAEMPHRAKITASMRLFKLRQGRDSEQLRKEVQEALVGIYPGVSISVEKDAAGPPAGYPVNIELEGKDYEELIVTAERMVSFINDKNIPGIEELKIDVNKGKPAMEVMVDRQKAGELGVSASQVGQQLRRSVFGEKAGVYKEEGEDYDIYVRFEEEDRYNYSALFNQNITFRDQATGRLKEIPLSSVAKQKNTSGFSAIKHKDGKRVVTVYSGLKPGFTDAGAIVAEIQKEMTGFPNLSDDIKIDYTGQIEEQNKQMNFLMSALMIGLGLIFFILIFQFNSISKPMIIMIAIFLSFIGVFLGLMATGAPFVIMMTMMGIISLAGIVVNNGVVLIDYVDLLKARKKEKLNMDDEDILTNEDAKEAIVKGGRARLRPVILTAITTVLGLVPLAIGLNINFFTLFSDFDPKIYIGGDNVIFWGPLAWTVIYGLLFATFLTLIIVPVLLVIVHRVKFWVHSRRAKRAQAKSTTTSKGGGQVMPASA